jgi:hypothetical protein
MIAVSAIVGVVTQILGDECGLKQAVCLSTLSRSDFVHWPEAAVHRNAAICPQLEYKPTWHGHREYAAATASRLAYRQRPAQHFRFLAKASAMPVTDMADRARISAWRPLMAEAAGPHARRVVASPYGVREQQAAVAAVGPSWSEAAWVGERRAAASLGERPVAVASRGEQRTAMASLGERAVALASRGEQRAAMASLGERPAAGRDETAWLQVSTGAFCRRRAPPLPDLWQQTRDAYHRVQDPSQPACHLAAG